MTASIEMAKPPKSGIAKTTVDLVSEGRERAGQPGDGGVDRRVELDRGDELAVQGQELRKLAVLGQVARAVDRDLVHVACPSGRVDDVGRLERLEGCLLVRRRLEAVMTPEARIRAWYRANRIGSWRTTGRQPPNWLTPCSL